MNIQDFINSEIRESVAVKRRLLESVDLMEETGRIAGACIRAFQAGNRILFAGNGGSAADAQHLAAEFVSRFYYDRPGLPALSLSTDPSAVTAIGNDYGYDKLFARQVQAHGRAGDVLVAISTSGKSPNILQAIRVAQELKMVTVALTGEGGGEMAALCDYRILVPSTVTPKIQECHITIGHAICAAVEAELFPKSSGAK
jgi:D-sedoheptulose 7-phosphate isomerase